MNNNSSRDTPHAIPMPQHRRTENAPGWITENHGDVKDFLTLNSDLLCVCVKGISRTSVTRISLPLGLNYS